MDAQTQEFVDVIQRAKRAKSFVEGWRSNVDRWRSLYDQKHYSIKPKRGEVQYVDPTYTNTVDLAVGIMLGNSLRWHAYGTEPSKKEEDDTGNIEKVVQAIMEVNDEREETNQKYEIFLNFVRDGGAVIYSVYDPKIAEKSKELVQYADENSDNGVSEQYVLHELPVRMQVIDPKKFICLPGGEKRWLMVGRTESMSILDVELIYKKKLDRYAHLGDEDKSSTKGELMDLWDYVIVTSQDETGAVSEELAVRNTVVYEGEPLLGPRIMVGYKDLPYTVQFYKPTSKDDTNQWHSILSPLEATVSQLERSVNRRARQIDVYTALPIISKTQPGRPVQVDQGLFNHVNLTTDESLEFPTWPGNAPDVQVHIDFLRSRIQQSGFSDVMFGSGQNQIAGYALSQLGDQNRIRLEQPIEHLELLLTQWAKKTLSLLTYYAEGAKLCVYGHIRGKNYADYIDVDSLAGYSLRAEVRAMYPNEQTRNVAMSTQVKGVLSNYTIMQDYLGIEQPEDEQERLMIEQVSANPLVMQYTIMQELSERAQAGDKVAAMVLQQIQNQAAPTGANGRPKEPNNPEPPIGLQSSTGQPTSQAQGREPAGQSASDQQDSLAANTPTFRDFAP